MQHAVRWAHQNAQAHLQKSAKLQAKMYERGGLKIRQYRSDELVWRYYLPSATQKLKAKWTGPWKVIRVYNNNTIRIAPCFDGQFRPDKHILVHASCLKPCGLTSDGKLLTLFDRAIAPRVAGIIRTCRGNARARRKRQQRWRTMVRQYRCCRVVAPGGKTRSKGSLPLSRVVPKITQREKLINSKEDRKTRTRGGQRTPTKAPREADQDQSSTNRVTSHNSPGRNPGLRQDKETDTVPRVKPRAPQPRADRSYPLQAGEVSRH